MTTTVRNLYNVMRYDTAVYITTCQRYAWGYIPGQPGTFRWTPLGNPLKGDVRMSIYTAAAAAAFSFVLFVLFVLFPFLSFFLYSHLIRYQYLLCARHAYTRRAHVMQAHRPLLVALYMLSDCPAGAGGTVLVPGSHRWVEKKVDEVGEISHPDLNRWCVETVNAKLKAGGLRMPVGGSSGDGGVGEAEVIHQVTGKAGDVVLMHAWCIHSGSTNADGIEPRLMGNAHVHVAPMFQIDHLVQVSALMVGGTPIRAPILAWRICMCMCTL